MGVMHSNMINQLFEKARMSQLDRRIKERELYKNKQNILEIKDFMEDNILSLAWDLYSDMDFSRHEYYKKHTFEELIKNIEKTISLLQKYASNNC